MPAMLKPVEILSSVRAQRWNGAVHILIFASTLRTKARPRRGKIFSLSILPSWLPWRRIPNPNAFKFF